MSCIWNDVQKTRAKHTFKVSWMMRLGLFAEISLAKVEGHGEATRVALKKTPESLWRKWHWQLLRVTDKKGCRKKKVFSSRWGMVAQVDSRNLHCVYKLSSLSSEVEGFKPIPQEMLLPFGLIRHGRGIERTKCKIKRCQSYYNCFNGHCFQISETSLVPRFRMRVKDPYVVVLRPSERPLNFQFWCNEVTVEL